jgi:bacterioferritin
MKGEERVINQLNELLADELTAINQYMVHSEMCDNWGYERLHKSIEERAIQEMKHAEALIARILYFEGTPIVSTLNKINIGQVVEAQIKNDLAGEISAAEMYNNGILLCVEARDHGTRELLESILKDEEYHIDWLESQLDQINQMGIQNYLAQQVG